MGETAKICLDNVTDTVKLLRRLGFTIHPGKSVFVPTQKITFLGFIIDSVKMTITLTEGKKKLMAIYGLLRLLEPWLLHLQQLIWVNFSTAI